MSDQTSIPVSKDVRDALKPLKADGESWDDFFRRVIETLDDDFTAENAEGGLEEVTLSNEDHQRIQSNMESVISGFVH